MTIHPKHADHDHQDDCDDEHSDVAGAVAGQRFEAFTSTRREKGMTHLMLLETYLLCPTKRRV